jgi:hypothetical protein
LRTSKSSSKPMDAYSLTMRSQDVFTIILVQPTPRLLLYMCETSRTRERVGASHSLNYGPCCCFIYMRDVEDTRERYTHTYILVMGWGSIAQLFGFAVTLLCFFPYTRGRRGAVKPDSNQSPKGSDWNVSRRFPDYAERPHAVLSREGGPQDLGLGDRP